MFRGLANSPRPQTRQCSPLNSPRSKVKEEMQGGGYLLRIPAVKRSGDILADQVMESQFDLLAQMVETMVSEPMHIGPVHGFLSTRVSLHAQQVQADADSKFKFVPTLKSLPT